MNKMIYRLLWIFVFLLAGCGGDDSSGDPLPTLNENARATSTAAALDAENAALAAGTDALAQVATDPSDGDESDRATLPSTWTPTPTATDVPTITVTPSATITVTPSLTPTPTITETLPPSGLLNLALTAAVSTPVPSQFVQIAPTITIMPGSTFPPGQPTTPATITAACPYIAPGGFGTALTANPALAAQIGCPSGLPPTTSTLNSATQRFERGAMIWVNDTPGVIYVLYDNGDFQRFEDTFVAGTDPDSGGENPPAGLIEPVRGFGKVWRINPGVRDRLGWATTGEAGGTSVSLAFNAGRMIASSSRGDILALLHRGGPSSGTWQAIAGGF